MKSTNVLAAEPIVTFALPSRVNVEGVAAKVGINELGFRNVCSGCGDVVEIVNHLWAFAQRSTTSANTRSLSITAGSDVDRPAR